MKKLILLTVVCMLAVVSANQVKAQIQLPPGDADFCNVTGDMSGPDIVYASSSQSYWFSVSGPAYPFDAVWKINGVPTSNQSYGSVNISAGEFAPYVGQQVMVNLEYIDDCNGYKTIYSYKFVTVAN